MLPAFSCCPVTGRQRGCRVAHQLGPAAGRRFYAVSTCWGIYQPLLTAVGSWEAACLFDGRCSSWQDMPWCGRRLRKAAGHLVGGRQTRPALFALLHLHSSLPRNQLLLDGLLK